MQRPRLTMIKKEQFRLCGAEKCPILPLVEGGLAVSIHISDEQALRIQNIGITKCHEGQSWRYYASQNSGSVGFFFRASNEAHVEG